MWISSSGCKIQQLGAPGSYTYHVSEERANYPVNVVSWGDAVRFSNWMYNGQPVGSQNLGTTEDGSYFLNGVTSDGDMASVLRRDDATWVLPLEDEWYKAAYHKNDGLANNYYDYPTSSDIPPSIDITDPDPGNTATYSSDIRSYLTAVGSHENSSSPYGTFDQGGNVFEFVESKILTTQIRRGVRGGSDTSSVNDLHASYWNSIIDHEGESPSIGFRLVIVPEPSTIVVMLFLTAILRAGHPNPKFTHCQIRTYKRSSVTC